MPALYAMGAGVLPGVRLATARIYGYPMATTLRVAIGMLGIQAMALFGLAVLMVTWAIGERADYRGWILIGCVLALAALCGWTGYALSQLKAGARGIGIGMALLTGVPASYMAAEGSWYGWALAAWALVLVMMLVAPTSGRALGVSS